MYRNGWPSLLLFAGTLEFAGQILISPVGFSHKMIQKTIIDDEFKMLSIFHEWKWALKEAGRSIYGISA
jgi:hypothetical protein